ncbi:hypothetical protein R3P38DRAFT_3027639 [Favolaschia claudopus]|uniref:Uncharacterized protein n=1 Tax=Favolaschia claudopus TaxID=2862362 RepID=A0AAW0AEN8_9AGAR
MLSVDRHLPPPPSSSSIPRYPSFLTQLVILPAHPARVFPSLRVGAYRASPPSNSCLGIHVDLKSRLLQLLSPGLSCRNRCSRTSPSIPHAFVKPARLSFHHTDFGNPRAAPTSTSPIPKSSSIPLLAFYTGIPSLRRPPPTLSLWSRRTRDVASLSLNKDHADLNASHSHTPSPSDSHHPSRAHPMLPSSIPLPSFTPPACQLY